MTFLDFFAGIGNFRLGMEQAGHKCVGFCEIDKYAVASYTAMHLLKDDQRRFLATLPKSKRKKEILKDEYKNGEWYSSDIMGVRAGDLPRADCWCWGSPCTSFALPGKRAGLKGASGLVMEIFRLLNELPEEDRPEWLIYENVKGMLSSNKGWDYAAILSEMDNAGYDIEWQRINSAWFVPQNRERIFTIGHNRRYGSCKIFPIEANDGQYNLHQIGKENSNRNKNQYRVYDTNGISPCLNATDGGGQRPNIEVPCFIDLTYRGGWNMTNKARTITARYFKGATSRQGETCGVAIPVGEDYDGTGTYVEMPNGETVYARWNPNRKQYIAIRKLTPRECFRLQGVPDEYFERAESVNSDTQLWKQSGNAVTVPVIKAIGEKLRKCEEKQNDVHNADKQ